MLLEPTGTLLFLVYVQFTCKLREVRRSMISTTTYKNNLSKYNIYNLVTVKSNHKTSLNTV